MDDPTPSCPACELPLEGAQVTRGSDRLHGSPGEFDVLTCPACGAGITTPIVEESELGNFYPDDYNAYALPDNPLLRWLATTLFRSRYRRALRRHPLELLIRSGGGEVLDVGGGRGDLGVMLEPFGWKATVLDPSPAACEAAEARGQDAFVGTLSDSPAGLESGLDAIVFQHSLEHVANPYEALEAALRLLRPGGLLVIILPNYGSWPSRRFGADWFHLDLPRHRTHMTKGSLSRLIVRAGFEDPQLSTSTSSDGLPMSIEYRLVGGRSADQNVRLVLAALGMLLLPVTLATSVASGQGDILHASAKKPTAHLR